jgi:hypothetical protein
MHSIGKHLKTDNRNKLGPEREDALLASNSGLVYYKSYLYGTSSIIRTAKSKSYRCTSDEEENNCRQNFNEKPFEKQPLIRKRNGKLMLRSIFDL